MGKKRKILLTAVFLVLLGIFAFSGYKLYSILHGYKADERMYDDLNSSFVTKRDTTSVPVSGSAHPSAAPIAEGETEEAEYIDPEISPFDVDFQSLLEISEDVCGWIYCPDTVINYPIVRGEDNFYYLERFIDGNWNNGCGTLFVDCECPKDFSGSNTVIYGHRMNDGSMFAPLGSYKDPAYYEAHPVMYLNTPTANYRIEIFAGYTTPYDSDTYTLTFPDEAAFGDFLSKIVSQSDFKTDVEVGASDRIVTLSTCAYDFQNARYVVHGKLVRIH